MKLPRASDPAAPTTAAGACVTADSKSTTMCMQPAAEKWETPRKSPSPRSRSCRARSSGADSAGAGSGGGAAAAAAPGPEGAAIARRRPQNSAERPTYLPRREAGAGARAAGKGSALPKIPLSGRSRARSAATRKRQTTQKAREHALQVRPVRRPPRGCHSHAVSRAGSRLGGARALPAGFVQHGRRR